MWEKITNLLKADLSSGNPYSWSGAAAGELTASSGTQNFFNIAPRVNQTSTAGYNGILLNSTHAAVGSGTKQLLDLQVDSVSQFAVSTAGDVTANTVSSNTINVAGAFTLPTSDGTSGQVMQTDGNKVLTWTTPSTDAPTDATYLTSTANGTLSAEKVIDNTSLVVSGNTAKVADRIELNSLLSLIKTQEHAVAAYYQIVNGIVDVFSDETGVDTATSTNETYSAANDSYAPTTTDKPTLLVHWNGTDGATSYTTEDDGARTVTFADNAQLDTAQQKFGTASLLCDGTGDYTTLIDSDDWHINGDFTIDFWVRFNTLPAKIGFISQYVDGSNALHCIWRNDTDLISWNQLDSGVDRSNYTCSWTPSINTWYHIEFVRSGSSPLYIFIDGVSQAVTENTAWGTIANLGSTLRIGFVEGHAAYLDGWMDETRIIKGTAAHTSNFTPPVSEYTNGTIANMTLQSNGFTPQYTSPNQALLMLQEQDVSAITLNTDLKGWVSVDNEDTWNQITLLDYGYYTSTTHRILAGTVDTSAATTGNSVRWKVTTHNNKDLNIHGVGLTWE